MSNIEYLSIFALVLMALVGWGFGWLMLSRIRELKGDVVHQKYLIERLEKRVWDVSHDIRNLSKALGYEKKETHLIRFVKKDGNKS